MPRVAAPPLALALGLAAALAVAACGGGSDAKLLAGNTAQEIRENLDSVQRLVDEGECVGAEDAALSVSSQVEAIEGIDPKLKQLLQEGAGRLNEVVDQCEEAEATVEETTPPPTTESPEAKAKAEKESEKEEQEAEKEQEQAEKEEEKEQKAAEKEQEKAEKEEEKEQKAAEKEQEHEEAEGGEPSGGVGPGSAPGEGG
jgi:septal ring-binding cell division protein DamX